MIKQALEFAAQLDSEHSVPYILDYGLRRSVARRAVKVVQYLLEQGADVKLLHGRHILPTIDEHTPEEYSEDEKPSLEILEILIAHGWNVNTRDITAQDADNRPLIWWIVRYPDLVQWCLDHGARVDIPEPRRQGYSYDPPQFTPNGDEIRHSSPRGAITLLGVAASEGTVETFELLRAKGAPMDPRVLHMAVQKGRLEMMRHLVDVVGLDVNAVEHQVGDSCSTPLCYLAAHRQVGDSQREMIDFLLDHGADPDLEPGREGEVFWQSPNACARQFSNAAFLEAVQTWRTRQKEDKGDQGSK
jgi:ankyrin repeat protein